MPNPSVLRRAHPGLCSIPFYNVSCRPISYSLCSFLILYARVLVPHFSNPTFSVPSLLLPSQSFVSFSTNYPSPFLPSFIPNHFPHILRFKRPHFPSRSLLYPLSSPNSSLCPFLLCEFYYGNNLW